MATVTTHRATWDERRAVGIGQQQPEYLVWPCNNASVEIEGPTPTIIADGHLEQKRASQ